MRGTTRLISVSRGGLFDGSVDLGHEPPLIFGEKREEGPIRRAVSPRWLAGTILTGFISIFLMGGALMAALNNPNQFAEVPESFGTLAGLEDPGRQFGGKGDRIKPLEEEVANRQILQVSTVTRQGERDFIKLRPFAKVTATLVAPKPDMAARIPVYDALRLFADNSAPETPKQAGAAPGGSDQIYSANVDGEVSVKIGPFPLDDAGVDATAGLAAPEIEQVVRAAANLGGDGAFDTAAMQYADINGDPTGAEDPFSAMGVKILQENVSNIAKSDGETGSSVEEKIIAVAKGDDFRDILTANAVPPSDADSIAGAMSGLVDIAHLRPGQKLRVGYTADEAGIGPPLRVSIYEDGVHQATVARSDRNDFVRADEPIANPGAMADAGPAPEEFTGGLPRVYDAVYETALEQEIPSPLIDQLIRIFAFDVDFQSRITPGDTLEVFHSLPDPNDRDAAEPEILFASLTLGGATKRFYRFRTADDGVVDYYDDEGKSAKKFLMRKPLGVGVLRSGFGWRLHPILGYRRLHAGVDYSAPRGTPIFAAGSGVVEKAGRSSGYGNLTLIQHTNGYETAYGHQSSFAKGIVPGTRVRQGQIIGYVGSTGLSTGPHLHFEIRVNAKAVDPLRIRLPRGRVLQADLLKNFEHERDRINTLLGTPAPAKVASTN